VVKISVVIPCYNSEHTIRETLESVLAQTYHDFEVIVVDDGSTDGSKDVILSFGDRVRYIYQQNAGQSAARNAGIREARGEYIAFIDADDLWFPEKLEKQDKCLQENNVLWCYCDCMFFRDSDHKNIGKYSQLLYSPKQGLILQALFMGNCIASLTPIINKKLLFDSGLFDETPAIRSREDWDQWLRVAALAEVAYTPEVLAKYRVHAGSITYAEDPQEAFESHVAVIEKITALYPQELLPLKQKTLAYYANRFSRTHWLNGNADQAKKLLQQAIFYEPGRLQYRILMWIYSLPAEWVNFILKIRNKNRDWFRK
jgi:glycosyltransferase involved in cell wall biosynthesis